MKGLRYVILIKGKKNLRFYYKWDINLIYGFFNDIKIYKKILIINFVKINNCK